MLITLRLGFCATRFDPVHDVVVFAVADGPFLSSFGPFLRVCFRRVVLFHAWHVLKLYYLRESLLYVFSSWLSLNGNSGVVHFTVNTNGEVTAEFANVNIQCR